MKQFTVKQIDYINELIDTLEISYYLFKELQVNETELKSKVKSGFICDLTETEVDLIEQLLSSELGVYCTPEGIVSANFEKVMYTNIMTAISEAEENGSKMVA